MLWESRENCDSFLILMGGQNYDSHMAFMWAFKNGQILEIIMSG